MMMTRPPHTGLCSDFYVFKWALTRCARICHPGWYRNVRFSRKLAEKCIAAPFTRPPMHAQTPPGERVPRVVHRYIRMTICIM